MLTFTKSSSTKPGDLAGYSFNQTWRSTAITSTILCPLESVIDLIHYPAQMLDGPAENPGKYKCQVENEAWRFIPWH